MIRAMITCLLVLSAGICFAESGSGNTLLWQISGKGLTRPSYMFGTLHLICAKDFVWNTQIDRSIAASDKVCFELDLDDPSLYNQMAVGMSDTSSDDDLHDVLTTAEYARLERYLQDSLRMNLATMQHLNPTTLSSLILVRVLGCGIPVSYEMKIMEQAEKAKKEIIGLEQLSEQMSVLDSIPAENAGKELMQLVDSLPAFRAEYDRMVSIYKQQNLAELCKWIQTADMPWEPLNTLLDDRNKKWIGRMKTQLESGSVFYAVGAAHLCGPNGLIVLLRKAGYTLSPVY